MQRGKLEKRTKALADNALLYLKKQKGSISNRDIRIKAFCECCYPFCNADICKDDVKLMILEKLKSFRDEVDPDPLMDDIPCEVLLESIDTAIALVENECFNDFSDYMHRLGECFNLYSKQEA